MESERSLVIEEVVGAGEIDIPYLKRQQWVLRLGTPQVMDQVMA
jgi:hypothetical protein